MADKYEKYRNLCYQFPGIKQNTEDTCWCAALAWWIKALKGGRPQLNQEQIYNQYAGFTVNGWNNSNLIAPNQYQRLLSEPKWKADVVFKPAGFGPTYLNQKLEKGPIIIGYWNPGGGHVVVMVAPSITYQDRYMVMDPAFGNVRPYGYGKFSTYSTVLVATPKVT